MDITDAVAEIKRMEDHEVIVGKMLQSTKLSDEEIAELVGGPIEFVREIKKELRIQ